MKKYKIHDVMVTTIFMLKRELITKEKENDYCMGRNDRLKESFNDDLGTFLEDISIGKRKYYWHKSNTYHIPKLTEKEMDLIEQKDIYFLARFDSPNPDVYEPEMKASESDAKFCLTECRRLTFTISLPDPADDD